MTSGKSEIYAALERWLPYPVYKFVGGPIDGEHRQVRLVETPSGMIAPEIWRVQVPHARPRPCANAGHLAMVESVETVGVYRFLPTNAAHNSGHYEFIDQ